MRFERTLFVFYLLVAGAAFAAPWDAGDGVIFPPDKAPGLLRQCSRATPHDITGYWLPSESQIAALEPKLSVLVDAESRRRHDAEEKQLADFSAKTGKEWKSRPWQLPVYVRQYAGLVQGGHKIIYVNGFYAGLPRDMPPDRKLNWREQPVIVCDGGASFFGVEYDPQAKTFANLAFNGMA